MSEKVELKKLAKLGDLESVKRAFFNKEYDNFKESLNQPFKFYQVSYEFDPEDTNRLEFILNNKNRGFQQRFEELMRVACVRFDCIKNKLDEVNFTSYWIVNVENSLTELEDFDGFTINDGTMEECYEYFMNNEETLATHYLH